MRCRACNSMDAPVHAPPLDWYCEVCASSIQKATGEEFTLSDLMELILGPDRPVKEYTK